MKKVLFSEIGRTLIEMLSVLAIMGILSITAVWAYNNAMNKHKANTLIDEAQKRAVVVAAQIALHDQTPSLSEFSNNTPVGTFDLVRQEDLNGQFGLQVSGVEKGVCQQVLNLIGTGSPIRRLSYLGQPTTPMDECDDTSIPFLIVYNEDLSKTDTSTSDTSSPTKNCTEDTECGAVDSCSICDNGTCRDNACQEVGYLKSSGSQYINTGLYPKLDTYTVECKAIKEQGTSLFGASDEFGLTGAGSGHFARYDKLYDSDTKEQKYAKGFTLSDSDPHIWKLAKNELYLDSETTSRNSFKLKTNEANSPLYLFSRGPNNDAGTHTVYYCKVWDGDNLIRHFVPVLKGDKPAMLDRVNNKLYFNEGSGKFSTGSN